MKETSHMYTQGVILTWRSWWKTPVFVLAPLQLPCLRGDVTQSREMNWVNLNHWVGLTKQCRDEWWFTVAAVWPARFRISWEPERFSLKPQTGSLIHALLSAWVPGVVPGTPTATLLKWLMQMCHQHVKDQLGTVPWGGCRVGQWVDSLPCSVSPKSL